LLAVGWGVDGNSWVPSTSSDQKTVGHKSEEKRTMRLRRVRRSYVPTGKRTGRWGAAFRGRSMVQDCVRSGLGRKKNALVRDSRDVRGSQNTGSTRGARKRRKEEDCLEPGRRSKSPPNNLVTSEITSSQRITRLIKENPGQG